MFQAQHIVRIQKQIQVATAAVETAAPGMTAKTETVVIAETLSGQIVEIAKFHEFHLNYTCSRRRGYTRNAQVVSGQYLCDGQPDATARGDIQNRPEMPLKHGQLCIKGRAVKGIDIHFPATVRERSTPRCMQHAFSGSPELMGNPVQAADHGTVGIQPATPLEIEWAHDPYGELSHQGCLDPAPGPGRPPANLVLQGPFEGLQAFEQIVLFDVRVVKKKGPAAAVFTARTVESIERCGFLVSGIHA